MFKDSPQKTLWLVDYQMGGTIDVSGQSVLFTNGVELAQQLFKEACLPVDIYILSSDSYKPGQDTTFSEDHWITTPCNMKQLQNKIHNIKNYSRVVIIDDIDPMKVLCTTGALTKIKSDLSVRWITSSQGLINSELTGLLDAPLNIRDIKKEPFSGADDASINFSLDAILAELLASTDSSSQVDVSSTSNKRKSADSGAADTPPDAGGAHDAPAGQSLAALAFHSKKPCPTPPLITKHSPPPIIYERDLKGTPTIFS